MAELNQREREVLDHLLSIESVGRDELRKQVDHAQVKLREPGWIEFTIDDTVPAAEVENVPPVEARVSGTEPPIEILLFVSDGRLKNLEVVTYGEPLPVELPSAEELDPPVALGPIAWERWSKSRLRQPPGSAHP